MSDLARRDALKIIAAVPTAGVFSLTGDDVVAAWQAVARIRRTPLQPAARFFTAHEFETVRLLVDLIIPRDVRSGSATDAGVPEFIDFIVHDEPERQTAMRGGLAWLDAECDRRFGKTLIACSDPERRSVLDDIAWPARARPEFSHGVSFFNIFRDLTASGFWSSRMGVEDLRYLGNTFVAEWNGCPEEALRKLGVRYEG
jgi:hypothetical protein